MLGEVLDEKKKLRKVSKKLTEQISSNWKKSSIKKITSDRYNFRVSELYDFCPRLYAISAKNQLEFEKQYDWTTLWRFAVGTAYHRAFQDEVLLALGDLLQGWWRCKKCGTVLYGDSKPPAAARPNYGWRSKPDACWSCGREDSGRFDHSIFEYEELRFFSDEYKLAGHCDGILVWPDGEHSEVLEIKTINSRGFEFVDPFIGGNPIKGHVLQLNIYMWFAGLDKGRILYICKNEDNISSATAEHEIIRDDGLINDVLDSIKLTISSIENGTIPCRQEECKTVRSKRVKNCPAGDICMSI